VAVIQTLLDKFLISDACHKFALYEKINVEHPTTPGMSFERVGKSPTILVRLCVYIFYSQ